MGLFHKHVWKLVDKEYLRTVYRDRATFYEWFPRWRKYKVYAYYYECVTCEKTKVEEHFVLIV